MYLLAILFTILLSLCSTAILSFISMAVMVGPWIELTMVLVSSLLFWFARSFLSQSQRTLSIGLVTAGSSIGGIVAIACGFSFPVLYFLEPETWAAWLAQPFYFSLCMAGLCLTAGSLGILVAQKFEHQLLVEEQLPFPIGQMAAKMILAQNQVRKSVELAIGFASTLIYSVCVTIYGEISRFVLISSSLSWGYVKLPAIRLGLSELPLLWSIGFVTGRVIVIPLLAGIFTKICIATPLHGSYFAHLKSEEFLLAFSSGMILYTTFIGFSEVFISALRHTKTFSPMASVKIACLSTLDQRWDISKSASTVLLLTSCSLFLSYFDFGWSAQLYLLVATIIAGYQLLLIGGRTGLAPMGRFATFILVPGLLLFRFNAVQIALVSTFVEICGGVAVDTLFGRRMALTAQLDHKKIVIFQWIGLIVSALSIGFFFWLLTSTWQLGSAKLIAQRAHMRALMVGGLSFDFFALLVGALCGAILKEWKVNTALVLTGILMPLESSLILAVGGLSTYLVQEPERYYPLWSGVFAAGSLWIIFQALLFL
jgi:hypothetical protein